MGSLVWIAAIVAVVALAAASLYLYTRTRSDNPYLLRVGGVSPMWSAPIWMAAASLC